MAFLLTNFSRQTVAMNAGLDTTVTPNTAAPQIFSYMSTTDAVATIEAANYFTTQTYVLCVNDLIFCVGSDSTVLLQVATINNTVNPPTITTQTVGFATSVVGTANISNNAVTYAKIQTASADTLIGNPTGGTANVEEITLGNALAFSGTTLGVPATVVNYASGSITAAQWNGMYATPIQIVAAPGANKAIVIDKFWLNMTFVAAQYAAGGVVSLQYENTVHGAGVAASQTVAAATINGIAANSFLALTSVTAVTATATVVNQGVYLSNATGAFTTGDGTWTWDCWYRIVPAA
jgi:hypothetical protein